MQDGFALDGHYNCSVGFPVCSPEYVVALPIPRPTKSTVFKYMYIYVDICVYVCNALI